VIDHPISLRELRVVAVRDVTPGMRLVTLTGTELGAFVRDGIDCPPFVTCSPDDHVKLFFERDGELVLPSQDVGHLDWPEDRSPTSRDYTVRSFDAVKATLDIEMLTTHDGPGGDWARELTLGDRIHVAGPPYSLTHPIDTGPVLLVGDDAALPAIARFFDEAAPGVDMHAIVLVEPDQATYPLPSDRVTVVVRSTPGADVDLGPLLTAAWERMPPAFVWGGLEYSAARALRRELKDRGVSRDRSYVSHYWRRDEYDRVAALAEAQKTLGALTDMMTPWAIRIAATLGIADAIAEGAREPAAIAATVGADPLATRTLMAYLATVGVFTRTNGLYELTALSELLLDGDEHGWRDELDLDGAAGHMDASLDGMRLAVETGKAGFDLRHGKSFWEALNDEPQRGARFDAHLDGWVGEWSPAVIADPVWRSARHVVDVGGGSGAFSARLLDAHPHLTATVIELPETATRATAHFDEVDLAARADAVGQSFFDALPTTGDTYVLAQVLHDWPDDEARSILRQVADAVGPDGRVVIIERLDDEGDDADHHAHMSLLMLTLFGSRERTVAEYTALLADVGLRVDDVRAASTLGLIVATPSP